MHKKKTLYLIHDFHFAFRKKYVFSCCFGATHLTSCARTKSNLYFDSSFDTVPSEHDLYKLLTFLVPNLMPIFRHLGRLSIEFVLVGGSCERYIILFLAPRPILVLGVYSVLFVRGCLFKVFAATLRSWRLPVHPLPEDAPCCSDRDPPNMVFVCPYWELSNLKFSGPFPLNFYIHDPKQSWNYRPYTLTQVSVRC
jgi:hypothetical protein